ncbi:MAG: hypothetical protein JWQ90_1057 [Hydrocarboniphaga sp.]|uniref:tetratricopeptide repeat protein n=1 Tax=Hydrocarboniphaga sp. TaxID=2033016 RepID=UPI0026239E86|nr:hypothetical protein [Hydrocarboniphaga sp.]MDB5968607.1 hypothetical protein [Hydrocarboniphaga sp.]
MKYGIPLMVVAILLAAQSPLLAADKPPALRSEVGKPLQAAQTALQAKNYDDAKANLAKAEAVGKFTSYESYIFARLSAQAAIGTGDYKGAAAAYEQIIASPELPAEEKVQTLDAYVRINYGIKDYAKTASAVQQYKQAGGNSAETLGLLAQSQYLSGQYGEAGQTLAAEIEAAEKAGQRPSDIQLQLLASCALKQDDMAAYTRALEKIVAYMPKREYWLDLIVRTSNKPGFSPNLALDVYRLRKATATLEDSADYMDASQLALQAGFPAEAKQFIDEGYDRKKLGEGADAARHKQLKDLVTRKIAEDRATLAEGEKVAAARAAGDALVATGYNLTTYGEADRGLKLMEQGLAKGGLKKPDQAKLLLGYAYQVAGSEDRAQKTFEDVSGDDGSKDVARLWLIKSRSM